jgi:hypothetical protein
MSKPIPTNAKVLYFVWVYMRLFTEFVIRYSLRPILLFFNMDVFITKMCLDTSTLVKSIMSRREYIDYDTQNCTVS